METNRERTQLILLRILGVLLIVVGFTMISRSSEGTAFLPAQTRHAIASRVARYADHCDRVHVEVRELTPPGPFSVAPPAPPQPPVPSQPPAPPIITFIR